MNWRLFAYGFWCLAIVSGYVGAASYGYSPFADGGRSAFRTGGVGGVGGYYGPAHK